MNGNKRLSIADVHTQSIENATNIALIQQNLASLQGAVTNLASTVDSYIKSDLASKRPNWSQWIAMGSLIALMTGGFWMVLTLKINAEIHPMSEKIVALESTQDLLTRTANINAEKISIIASQNQNSIDDRLNLNKKIDLLSERYTLLLSTQNAENAERRANEVEIETQFDADSQLRNTQFAEQQRMNKTLWNQSKKTLGEYPSAPFFFPNISKRSASAGTYRPQ